MNKGGHSEGVIADYNNRKEKFLNSLSITDQKIIKKIEVMISKLSEEGRDYIYNEYE